MYTITTNLTDTCPISQRIYKGLKYDYLVPTEQLKENEVNALIYKNIKAKKNLEYIEQLSISIDEQGLLRMPVVFADEPLLIGGHHRKRALEILGVSHIPVRHHDKGFTWKEYKHRPLDLMIIMASDNQRPPENEYDKWCILVGLMKGHKTQFKTEPTKSDTTSYGATAGFSYKKWLAYKTLTEGGKYKHPRTNEWVQLPPRPELWNDIVKSEKTLAWACKTQKNDAARDDGIILPKLTEHDNLVTKELCSKMMDGMGEYVEKVMDVASQPFKNTIYPMRWADKSVVSGFCSSYIEGATAEGLKELYNINAVKDNKGGHYDVTCEAQPNTFNKPYRLEVKHTFEKYWSSGTEKIGYNLLCQTNETYDKFFVVCVYVPEFTWSLGGHGPKKLSLNSLKGLDCKVLQGELYEDEKGNMKTTLQGVN